MIKTYSFSQAFSNTDPRFEEVCKALVACEREFNVEVQVHLNKITEPKRPGEYLGKEVPASAAGIRKAMGDFCDNMVPNSKFNFWKFTFELEDPTTMSVTEMVKKYPNIAMYTED